MNKMLLTKRELESIVQIVQENNLADFTLNTDNSSGIGYTLNLQYDTIINNRKAIVSIPITTEEQW